MPGRVAIDAFYGARPYVLGEVFDLKSARGLWGFAISGLGSARALACPFWRLAEMLLLFNQKKVVGEAPTTAREGACAPQKKVARSHSVRSASTGLSRLARRAGNKHASNAAIPRIAIVAINRSGLCVDVS
jgi:hypothetical protein